MASLRQRIFGGRARALGPPRFSGSGWDWQLLAGEDYLLLAAALSLPWTFGGLELWAYRLAALLLVAAACCAFWRQGLGGFGLRGGNLRWLLPAVLLGGWAALQLVPLPPGLIRVLSPEAYRIYASALPQYPAAADERKALADVEAKALERVPEARDVPPPDETGAMVPQAVVPACVSSYRPLSLHPDATQERLLWYVPLLLAFMVVARRTGDSEVYAAYRTALFCLFAVLAVYALIDRTEWADKQGLLQSALFKGSVFGVYGNPTHMGGAMELAAPWLAGHAWSQFRRKGRAVLSQAGFVLCCGAFVLCLAAGLLAASKMAAMLLGSSLLALAVVGMRSWRGRLAALGAGIAITCLAIVLFSGTNLGQRVQSFIDRTGGLQLGERIPAWSAAASMLGDFPITGSGFGTFREAYARYQPRGEYLRWAQAHNDYLEVLLDGGIIAGLLLLWLIGSYGSRLLKVTRRSLAAAALGRVGLALGVVALALHAFVDFNHQMPATALLFVTLCAMALQPHNSSQRTVSDP